MSMFNQLHESVKQVKESEEVTFFRVVAKDDAINNEETIGPEVKIVHLTREGAEAAKEDVDSNWDEDWGDQPETEISEVSFESREAAKEAGYIVRK